MRPLAFTQLTETELVTHGNYRIPRPVPVEAVVVDGECLQPGIARDVSTMWVLRNVMPTDDPTWPAVFNYVERNHYASDPQFWKRFLDSCSKKIKTPVKLHMDRHGRLLCIDGHHRVWAAVKLSLTSLPVVFTERLKQPHPSELTERGVII